MKRFQARILAMVALVVTLCLTGSSAWASASLESLIGTYRFVNAASHFWKYTPGSGTYIYDNIRSDVGTLTLNANGTCSLSYDEKEFEVGLTINQNVVTQEPEAGAVSCTYAVSSGGEVQVITAEDNLSLWASADGNVLVAGGGREDYEADGAEYSAELLVAVKAGSGLVSSALNGTFKAVSFSAKFDKSVSQVIKNIYANNVTLTFNGNGTCTFSLTGKDFEVNLASPNTVWVGSGTESGTGTYSVSPTGMVTVNWADEDGPQTWWLSADGSVLLSGHGGTRTDDDDGSTIYETGMLVAAKVGSGFTNASLNGTFSAVWLERELEKIGLDVLNEITGSLSTVKFDGQGKCSVNFDEEDFEVNLSFPTFVYSHPAAGTDSCTYSVASSGLVTLTFPEGKESAWLSANGNTLLSGGALVDGYDYTTSLLVAVNSGPEIAAITSITVPTSDPDGNYNVSWGASATKGVAYVLEEATNSTFTSNLKVAYEGAALSVSLTGRTLGANYFYRVKAIKAGHADSAWKTGANNCAVPGTVAATPSSLTVPAVDADGTFTISWGASASPGVTYMLQEATNSTFTTELQTVYEGSELTTTLTSRTLNMTYYYRVKAFGVGYKDSLWKTQTTGCKVIGPGVLAAAPLTITVPASNATGSYSVSWGASATKGVTYVLEEATDAGFTANRQSYPVSALNKAFTGKVLGTTYFYRVKAVHPEYVDSPWKAGVAGCAVPGTVLATPIGLGVWVSEANPVYRVPAVDADGSYVAAWTPATTTPPGVTYVLEEATNSTFSAPIPISVGPETSVVLAGRLQGTTYYYRVKVQKPGYKDSLWKTFTAGCKVIGPDQVAGMPLSITVPVSDTDGAYTVSWGASATKGVAYVLEEATDNNFSDAKSVYTGTALRKVFPLPNGGHVLGTTYYYRVKAVHPEYSDSPWREKTTGCAVPGTVLGVPASIVVPASDADGNYVVSWGSSPGDGVTYMLEEATNSTFTANRQTVYLGNDLAAQITERLAGLTYYYRVKAVSPGYKDSSWRVATNGCKVLNL